jgi:hypothetical protein
LIRSRHRIKRNFASGFAKPVAVVARRRHSKSYIEAALADPFHRENAIGPRYLEIMDRHFRGEPVEQGDLDNARVVAVAAERSVKLGVVTSLREKGYASSDQAASVTIK